MCPLHAFEQLRIENNKNLKQKTVNVERYLSNLYIWPGAKMQQYILWQESNLRSCDSGAVQEPAQVQLLCSNRKFMFL